MKGMTNEKKNGNAKKVIKAKTNATHRITLSFRVGMVDDSDNGKVCSIMIRCLKYDKYYNWLIQREFKQSP